MSTVVASPQDVAPEAGTKSNDSNTLIQNPRVCYDEGDQDVPEKSQAKKPKRITVLKYFRNEDVGQVSDPVAAVDDDVPAV